MMANKIEIDTALLMLDKLNRQLDDLYGEQESQKTQEMKCGGKVKHKMPDGGPIPIQGITDVNIGLGVDPSVLAPMNQSSVANTTTVPFLDNVVGGIRNTFTDPEIRGDFLNTLGTVAPIGYNLIQGLQRPEQMTASDFYNPKAGQALNRLGQKYDPSQQLRQAELDYATGARQVRSAAGGDRSTLLGNQAALMGATQRTKAGILDQTQRANLAQQSALAQAELGVGQNMAQTNLAVDQMNAQNRAARRNFLGQGFSDISGLSQTNRLMKNQALRDQQLLGLLPDMFASVYPFMGGLQNFKVN